MGSIRTRSAKIKIIKGIKVLNDCYNSNPLSMRAALAAIKSFPADSRWVVSGDMMELGKKSRAFHRAVGEMIASGGIDGLVTFGKFSQYTLDGARSRGMKESNLWQCRTQEEIAGVLKKIAARGDLVLFKGSRGMKMEEVIQKFAGN